MNSLYCYHKNIVRWLWLATAVLSVATVLGCGELSFIKVTVKGDYKIPDEVNVIAFRVKDVETDKELKRFLFNLEGYVEDFPVDFSLEVRNDKPPELKIKSSVSLVTYGNDIASEESRLVGETEEKKVKWEKWAVTDVALTLEDVEE